MNCSLRDLFAGAWSAVLLLCVLGLVSCRSTIDAPVVSESDSSTNSSAYRTTSSMQVLLYANTKFEHRSDLAPWGRSLDVLQLLALREWNIPADRVHRLENKSAQEFLAWLEHVSPSTHAQEVMLLYFATHQLRDGKLYFAHGPPLRGEDWVQAVNRLSEGRTVIVINDSCYAEKLEECGKFSSRVIRLHACGRGQQCSEVKLRNGSPAAMGLLRPERDYLEAHLGKRLDSASFFALLWLRASRELIGEGQGTITWQMVLDRIRSVRDQFDREVTQPHVQRPVAFPANANFDLLKRRTTTEVSP